MRLLPRFFWSNARDVLCVGLPVLDGHLLRAEFLTNHRVRARVFLADMLPKGAAGAELGVYTGLFSATLLRVARPRTMSFVDPWWLEFGEHYPDWGTYTSDGRVKTRSAHRLASRRIVRHAGSCRTQVVVTRSLDYLASLDRGALDWVYLDSTHSYEGTSAELRLLSEKLQPGALVAGDDWHDEATHFHAGVRRAVEEACGTGNFELIGSYPAFQWIARKV